MQRCGMTHGIWHMAKVAVPGHSRSHVACPKWKQNTISERTNKTPKNNLKERIPIRNLTGVTVWPAIQPVFLRNNAWSRLELLTKGKIRKHERMRFTDLHGAFPGGGLPCFPGRDVACKLESWDLIARGCNQPFHCRSLIGSTVTHRASRGSHGPTQREHLVRILTFRVYGHGSHGSQ